MSAIPAEAVADALKRGGWTLQMHVKLTGGSMYQHRSACDRRVFRMTHFPAARSRKAKEVFLFDDDNVDVEATGLGDILIGPKTFDSLDELAAAIARHDAAIASEREWCAAAPRGAQ